MPEAVCGVLACPDAVVLAHPQGVTACLSVLAMPGLTDTDVFRLTGLLRRLLSKRPDAASELVAHLATAVSYGTLISRAYLHALESVTPHHRRTVVAALNNHAGAWEAAFAQGAPELDRLLFGLVAGSVPMLSGEAYRVFAVAAIARCGRTSMPGLDDPFHDPHIWTIEAHRARVMVLKAGNSTTVLRTMQDLRSAPALARNFLFTCLERLPNTGASTFVMLLSEMATHPVCDVTPSDLAQLCQHRWVEVREAALLLASRVSPPTLPHHPR
jgi:hypothetical protein